MNNRQLYVFFTVLLGIAIPIATPWIPCLQGPTSLVDFFAFFGSYDSNGDLLLYLMLAFLGLSALLSLLRGFFFLPKEKNWKGIILIDLGALAVGLASSITILSQGGNVAFLLVCPFGAGLALLDAVFDQKMAQKDTLEEEGKRR